MIFSASRNINDNIAPAIVSKNASGVRRIIHIPHILLTNACASGLAIALGALKPRIFLTI